MAEDLLNSATRGDLAHLKVQLATYPDNAPNLSEAEIVSAAATAGHAEMVRWLIDERFPNFTPHFESHSAALAGGVPVYRIFVEKWPYLLNTDLGHHGNPIGQMIFTSSLRDNKPMLEFLLSKGADPNTAHYSGTFLNESFERWQAFRSTTKVPNDVVALLVAHGFTVPDTPGDSNLEKGKLSTTNQRKSSRCAVQ